MSIQLSKEFNDKLTQVYVGDTTLYFSYTTLVGFAYPGLGSVTIENKWSSVTGKHLNSIPAKYSKVEYEVFQELATELDRMFSREITPAAFIKKSLKKLGDRK